MTIAKRIELMGRVGTIKRIHVNQHNIRKNIHSSNPLPVITVQTSAGALVGDVVEIKGPSKVVYEDTPLSCGARVWIETTSEVVLG